MKYVELNISVEDALQAEILTALLSDYPFEAFADEESQLKAYIQQECFDECREEVEQLLASQQVDFQVADVEQQNWNAEWESGFEPVDVEGEHPIRIRAPHHIPAEGDVIDVVIAPRMSFGTGHHATTALMSQTIASTGVEGLRGLDMGCGTGVLAIVALKCGAEQMVAVDIDDWACDSCRDSIALSGVADRVDVRCGSIEQVVAGEQFDFILANINRNILISMMPSFSALLPTDGLLLMSGFLREDVPFIEASAMEQGFTVENIIEREGWMVVVCKKM
ncbi:MAG: 50S ribosomal protein L11 methyltransferase [Alistipes sp.]|nr:50S ribosomal protein L11 methyltransferase [Alistipes sp.]